MYHPDDIKPWNIVQAPSNSTNVNTLPVETEFRFPVAVGTNSTVDTSEPEEPRRIWREPNPRNVSVVNAILNKTATSNTETFQMIQEEEVKPATSRGSKQFFILVRNGQRADDPTMSWELKRKQ